MAADRISYSKREKRKKPNTADDKYDQMTVAQFSQSIRCSRSSNGDNDTPNPLCMIVPNQAGSSYKRKEAPSNQEQGKAYAEQRAEEIRANLDPKLPSFIKPMMPSHVAGGFWLGLPSQFCKDHLAKQNDVVMTLIDENEERYFTMYLPRKIGLSGGWKGFSIAHKLVVGDVLIFQLPNSNTFKVYIIRAYSRSATGGDIGLLTFHTHSSKTVKTIKESVRPHHQTPLFPAESAVLGSDGEEIGSEVGQGFRFLENAVELKDVKDIRSFTIAVDGLIIDSELSKEERITYYELCRSQKSFLHGNLLGGLSLKLAAGAIAETVAISNSIKSSTISTSREDFMSWDNKLEALELLGMNVGFLRARIIKLMNIVYKSVIDLRDCDGATVARAHLEEEITGLKSKLAKLDVSSKRFDTRIKRLKSNARRHELKFQAQVKSPWEFFLA